MQVEIDIEYPLDLDDEAPEVRLCVEALASSLRATITRVTRYDTGAELTKEEYARLLGDDDTWLRERVVEEAFP